MSLDPENRDFTDKIYSDKYLCFKTIRYLVEKYRL